MSRNTKQREEPLKKCMYCGATRFSRGMEPHVRNSDGNGHGPYQTVPDDYSLDKCEDAGDGSIDIHERLASDTKSGNELFLCHICGKRCKGYRGFMIHLGQKAKNNDPDHPDDSQDVEPNQYSIVPADEDWNPVEQFKNVFGEAGREKVGGNNQQDVVEVSVKDLYKIRSYIRDADMDNEVAVEELTWIIEGI